MLWRVSITHRRTGLPSTPLNRVFAVVADDSDSAETMAMASLGITRADVIKATTDAVQSMIMRIK